MSTSRVWKFCNDVDTDSMAPGEYMKFGIGQIAEHCLESLRPEFASLVRPGDVVVAGRNFGTGSSREQAPQALRELGVAAVVAVSFAGLFYRNALNLGLPVVICAEADAIEDGATVKVDFEAGRIELPAEGRVLVCEPIPPFLLEMIKDGGLVASLRRRFNAPVTQ